MARLPQPGGDTGNWGDILNDYLSQSLTSTGAIKADTISSTQLAADSVNSAALAPNAVQEGNLSTAVQTKLNADAPVQSVAGRTGAVTLTKTDVGLSNIDNTSDLLKPASADMLALTRIENQTVASVRALSSRNAARGADATASTEAWTDLSLWVAVNATVSSNRLYAATNAAWGVQRGISVPAGGRFMFRVSVKNAGGVGKSIYVGFNNDAAGGTITNGTPNGFAIGFSNGSAVSFKGSNLTGSIETPPANAQASADYLITGIVDESHITLTMQNETTGAQMATAKIARTQMPGGPVVNNVFFTGTDNSVSGNTAGPLVMMTELAMPIQPSHKVVAGRTLFGATKPLLYGRTDTATSIRHLIQLPSGYDYRVAAPVVIYMHGATGHAGTPFLNTTRELPVINALEAAGYIFASSDNGTSVTGNNTGFDDKFGNQAGIDDYVALAKYIREHFNTSAVFLMGVSMGGEFLQNILSQRLLGGVSAAVSICPGLDLVAAELDPTYSSGVRTAYGASDHNDFITKIAGKNPIDLPGYKLRGVPQRFYVASDDTVAPPATHVTPLRDRIAAYAPEAQVITTTGGHVAPSTYQPANVVAFFDTYRY